MAELTTLEEKLAEVIGLAQAAQGATEKVEGLVDDDEIAKKLQQMREEAEETEKRGTELAENRDGKKTAILDKAQETKSEATEMMQTYLGGEDVDGLDGFEFLVMAEAGEVGHWRGARQAQREGRRVGDLPSWSSGPCRSRSATSPRPTSCALTLAGDEDPYEES